MPAQFREGIAVAAFGGDVDSVNNGLPRERFPQQRDNAQIERSTYVVGIAQAGHQDHLWRQRAAEGGADGEAVRRGHDQVQKNDVGIVDRCGIEASRPDVAVTTA